MRSPPEAKLHPARRTHEASPDGPFDYFAYGLRVRTHRPISGLLAMVSGGPIDFHLHFRQFPRAMKSLLRDAQLKWSSPYETADGRPLLQVRESAGGAYFWFVHQDYEFLLDRSGGKGWLCWPERLSLDEMLPFIRGPLLGCVLRVRGCCSLHASAVARRGRALAFLGEAGAGKSTMAAALTRRGFTAITDDILRVETFPGGARVYPGYPNICLWPESVAMLCGAEDALPRIIPGWNKRFLDVSTNGHCFAAGPLPLGAIYVLGDRVNDESAPRIEPAAGNQRLLPLASNAYASWLADAAARARDFKTFAELAAGVPICRVIPHRDPARLPALLDIIERDFDTLVR